MISLLLLMSLTWNVRKLCCMKKSRALQSICLKLALCKFGICNKYNIAYFVHVAEYDRLSNAYT